MKPNAVLKSLNSNLRAMASRPGTVFHFFSVLSAVARALGVSFFIDDLLVVAHLAERVFALDTIDAAVAGQHAGIEAETLDLEGRAGEQRVVCEVIHHLPHRRAAQTRERDMGRVVLP